MEIAAGTVAVGASDAVVGDVEVADDHPDQEAQPAAAICRRRNTPLRKAEISSDQAIPVGATTHADSSPADSNLAVNSLAALTIAAPKAEVPVPLDLLKPARKTKSFSPVSRSRNIATSL